MNWELLAWIATIIGAAIAFCTVIINNTKAFTEVQCAISALQKVVEVQINRSNEQNAKLNEHETRIQILEHNK